MHRITQIKKQTKTTPQNAFCDFCMFIRFQGHCSGTNSQNWREGKKCLFWTKLIFLPITFVLVLLHDSCVLCVSKCSLYVFTIIPPRLLDPGNFITVLLVTQEPEQTTLLFWSDAFVLKRCVLRNVTWPSHSRPAIAADARQFQICFFP